MSRYKEIALEIKGPEQILYDKQLRNLIFDIMRTEEADELSKLLGNVDSYSYTSLSGLEFKAEASNILFSYFGVEPPESKS